MSLPGFHQPAPIPAEETMGIHRLSSRGDFLDIFRRRTPLMRGWFLGSPLCLQINLNRPNNNATVDCMNGIYLCTQYSQLTFQ